MSISKDKVIMEWEKRDWKEYCQNSKMGESNSQVGIEGTTSFKLGLYFETKLSFRLVVFTSTWGRY